MMVHPNMEGLDLIKKEVSDIKTYNLIYSIFELSLSPSVSIKIVNSKKHPNKTCYNTIIEETDLINAFEDCKSKIKPQNPYFIVYDFGYYNDQRNFRRLEALISYIPDSVNLKVKFTMAAHALGLSDIFNIPMLIEIHDISDLSYQHIKTECNNYHRNK